MHTLPFAKRSRNRVSRSQTRHRYAAAEVRDWGSRRARAVRLSFVASCASFCVPASRTTPSSYRLERQNNPSQKHSRTPLRLSRPYGISLSIYLVDVSSARFSTHTTQPDSAHYLSSAKRPSAGGGSSAFDSRRPRKGLARPFLALRFNDAGQARSLCPFSTGLVLSLGASRLRVLAVSGRTAMR